jgi:glycosyltransferase involved in cell wall biosynthesis
MTGARILVHDYAGHVAQVEVSRELARRGYQVLHLYAAGLETPRGALERRLSDPPTFDVQSVSFKGKFRKHNYIRRQIQEIEYGTPLTKAALAFQPDIVLSANTPLIPQAQLQWACHRARIPFVFWMTDIYCLAVQGGIREKLSWIGKAIVSFYRWLECFLVRRADGVIVIAERFKEILSGWGIQRSDVQVIPVCAPFEEIRVGSKDNAWAKAHGLNDTLNIIYSGTLGTKHNPGLISSLAQKLRGQANVRIVVVSEGPGADFLTAQKSTYELDNLNVLPFQPFESFANVLAAADILLAILEVDAATYSIPSKVISQLCAGRPQVIAVPSGNVVAEIVAEAGAGIVTPPGNENRFFEAVEHLLNSDEERARMGRSARQFAERELGVVGLGEKYAQTISTILSSQVSSQNTCLRAKIHRRNSPMPEL